MANNLTPDEVHELVAVQALHALDGPERENLERHLRTHPDARHELLALEQTAALLADVAPDEPPADIWERIATSLAPPTSDATRARLVFARPRHGNRLRRVVGVAAAILLVGFGAKIVSDGQRLQQVRAALHQDALVRAAQAAELSPNARHARLHSPDGRYDAEAVILGDGTAYLVRSNLPLLPADRTYQLWTLIDTSKISAGILGPRVGLSAFKIANHPWGLAITDEVATGATSSTHQPVVIGQVTT